MSISRCVITVLVAVTLITAGCRRSVKQGDAPDDVLVWAGDSALTMSSVLRNIPSGLSESDSIELFNSIVESWVEDMVLDRVAAANLSNPEKIEEMTRAYRNHLIVETYLREMGESAASKVDKDEIERYYNNHKEEMILEAPLIKGVYLRVPQDDSMLPELRKWMADGSPDAVDKIENNGLRQATQYDYFNDRWVAWNEIAGLIPYRFYDADAFLSSNDNFETTYNGSVYLLRILDYIPAGEPMPKEYALPVIEEFLNHNNVATYRRRLITTLYKTAIREGTLRSGLYDPLKRKMKSK